jgi:Cupin
VLPGEVFVVPQGLLHHNHNAQCTPAVFVQTFSSSDPGALYVIGALAALNVGSDAGAAAMLASGVTLMDTSTLGAATALDQVCLKTCGFPATGAPGDGQKGIPAEFAALF